MNQIEDLTPKDREAVSDLLGQVRERYRRAVGPRCPVCGSWRLRDGETRDKRGHAPGCLHHEARR